MNRVIYCFLCIGCIGAFATSPAAQQIASLDLTRLSTTPKSARAQTLPKGCRELTLGGMGDGAVLPPNDGPRDITVEIANLKAETVVIGTVVHADVRFRNTGTGPVRIPWNTDPNKIETERVPYHANWEEGNFTFVLGRSERLKNMTQPLYGSSLTKGSQIDILPGEWVTAKVLFQLELEYPLPGRSIKKGEQQMQVEWEQASQTRDVKDCAVWSGFFSYGGYYHQHNPAVMVRVN